MKEHIPIYFKEFLKEFNQFKGEMSEMHKKVDEIIEKQEMHFETIGEIKVQVTETNQSLREKASHEYVKGIDDRVEKIEKVVFA